MCFVKFDLRQLLASHPGPVEAQLAALKRQLAVVGERAQICFWLLEMVPLARLERATPALRMRCSAN
jgi:hypothetical protein